MDDGLGPRRVNLASPRGVQHVAVSELEIVKVRLHQNGRITGGFQLHRGSMGPHRAINGFILPIVIFELEVGEIGWVRFRPCRPWNSEGFRTLAPILWIDARPLEY